MFFQFSAFSQPWLDPLEAWNQRHQNKAWIQTSSQQSWDLLEGEVPEVQKEVLEVSILDPY